MSHLDSNPFAEPVVQAPAARSGFPDGLDNYNPYESTESASNEPSSNNTIDGPPPAYSAMSGHPARLPAEGHREMLRKQEELERKAAELQRREEQLNSRSMTSQNIGGAKNFPPVPRWCPVGPCFYQDIGMEIPPAYQRLVRMIFYLWLFYCVTLVLNLIGSAAYFFIAVDSSSHGTQFGMAIVQLILFAPCSFVLWFRPVYKAFRNDSSFNFMLFFFVMSAQILFTGIQALGISSNVGTCGWINALAAIGPNVTVGIIMMIVAAFFSFCGVCFFLVLVQVHRLYRSTGASFAKAQDEFSRGVVANPHVQNAAASAAAGAMASGTQSQSGGTQRY